MHKRTHRLERATSAPPGPSDGAESQLAKSDLQVRLANSRADYEGAFELLERRYRQAGLACVSSRRFRVMPYHLWEQSQVIVAADSDRVVATVTIVKDSRVYGLPMEESFPNVVAGLRESEGGLAEVCSLAIDKEGQRSTPDVFGQVTRLMMFYARCNFLHRLVAVVHPRHSHFYRRAMGFDVAGDICRYAQVEGQPGVALVGSSTESDRYESRWRQLYFEGQFTEAELKPRKMCQLDRAYFQMLAGELSGVTRRRAA